MIREFNSAVELREHYRRVQSRLPRRSSEPRKPAAVIIIPPPPKPMYRAPRFKPPRGSQLEKIREALFYIVHSEFGYGKVALRNPMRVASVVQARAVICWVAVDVAHVSLACVGRWLDRDHSTILHHVCIMRERMRNDENQHRRMHALAARVRALYNAAQPMENVL